MYQKDRGKVGVTSVVLPLCCISKLLFFICRTRSSPSKYLFITLRNPLHGRVLFIISIFKSFEFCRISPEMASMSQLRVSSSMIQRYFIKHVAEGISFWRSLKFCRIHKAYLPTKKTHEFRKKISRITFDIV